MYDDELEEDQVVEDGQAAKDAVHPDLQRQTDDIFGNNDLDKILSSMGVSAMNPNCNQNNNISQSFPSFDATLLSFGVNPSDIEGPLVQVPEEVRPAFDKLRYNLENDVFMDDSVKQRAEEPPKVNPSTMNTKLRKSGNVTMYKGIPLHQDENEECRSPSSSSSGSDNFRSARQKVKAIAAVTMLKAMNEGGIPAPLPRPSSFLPPSRILMNAPVRPPVKTAVAKRVPRVLPPQKVAHEAKAPTHPQPDELSVPPLGETSSVCSSSDDKEIIVEEKNTVPVTAQYDAAELAEFARQTEERRKLMAARTDSIGLHPRPEKLQKMIDNLPENRPKLRPVSAPKPKPAPPPDPVEDLAASPVVPDKEEDPLLKYQYAYYPLVHSKASFSPPVSALPIKETKTATFPWPQTFPRPDTLVQLGDILQVAVGAQFCCEIDSIVLAFDPAEDLSKFAGVQPTQSSAFSQSLALQAHVWGKSKLPPVGETCVVVIKEPSAVETMLRQAYNKGLYLSGLRTVYPSKNDGSNLRAHMFPHRRNLLLAFRGPHCHRILRDMIGPNSAKLAAKTDPQSINAIFETVVSSPPIRSLSDICWAFGGRVTDADTTKHTCSFGIFPAEPMALALYQNLSWTNTLSAINNYLEFGGTITAINPVKRILADGRSTTLMIHGIRECGERFLENLGLPGVPLEPPDHLGLVTRDTPLQIPWVAASNSFAHMSLPEVCIVNLKLSKCDDTTDVLSDVFAELPNVGTKAFAGGALEIVSIRIVDIDLIIGSLPSCMVGTGGGLTCMVCVWGLEAIARCQQWCERECRSVVAGASSKRLRYTTTMEQAFKLYHTFFFKRESFPIAPQVPVHHISSPSRFHKDLFSRDEQYAVVYIFPPDVIQTLARTLACLENNEFSLVAAIIAPLSAETKLQLLEQEVNDGFLTPDEASVLDGQVVQLAIQRCGAVQKLTELLAHASPQQNAAECRFSLRRGSRLHPHVRGTSSPEFAATLAAPNVLHAVTSTPMAPIVLPKDSSVNVEPHHTLRATRQGGALSLIGFAGAIFEQMEREATNTNLELLGVRAQCVESPAGRGTCIVETVTNRPLRMAKCDIAAETLEISVQQVA
eukprot:GEMP01003724.1.p1 GENE.GEMP01003724.1~~GEMP01003724.1.p1  ORF type:complete len:1102 (+),score=219.23 GEMP01003724.1:513-3818(+)